MGLSVSNVSDRSYPHPIVRVGAALIAIAAAFTTQNIWLLAGGALIGVVGLSILAGIHRAFLRFAIAVVLPISLALFVVWGWLVGAPPGQPLNSAPNAGFAYGAVVSLRLLILGGVGQLCMLTVRANDLPATMRAIGCGSQAIIVMMATFALLPELRFRTDQIITARYARGLVGKRNFLNGMLQVPFILRPLLSWMLRSALQRADAWRQRDITFVSSRLVISHSLTAGVVLVCLAWLATVTMFG